LARQLGRNEEDINRDVVALLAHDLVAQDDLSMVVVPWGAVELRLSMVAEHAQVA